MTLIRVRANRTLHTNHQFALDSEQAGQLIDASWRLRAMEARRARWVVWPARLAGPTAPRETAADAPRSTAADAPRNTATDAPRNTIAAATPPASFLSRRETRPAERDAQPNSADRARKALAIAHRNRDLKGWRDRMDECPT